jgi:hypothetical protein
MGGCAMKVSKRELTSVLLIAVSFFMGFSTPTGFSFGDKVFRALGVSPWSNGDSGTHYAVFVFLLLLIVGIIGLSKELSGRKLAVIIICCIVLSPLIVTGGKILYFKMHSGLAAVEYDSRKSYFNIKSTADNQNIQVSGLCVLTNYGRTSMSFRIKLPTDDRSLLSQDAEFNEPNDERGMGAFTLAPGETREIKVDSVVPPKAGISQVSGRLDGPDLILYSENESRLVGPNK